MPLGLCKIYLDSNILIAYNFDDDNQHNEVKPFLDEEWQNVQFFTSQWAFTELIKHLIKKRGWDTEDAYKFAFRLTSKQKVGENRFELIRIRSTNTYGIEDFFFELEDIMNETNSHLADSIHALIMRKNNISNILTMNRGDFDTFREFNILRPSQLEDFLSQDVEFKLSEETLVNDELYNKIVESFHEDRLYIESIKEEDYNGPYFKVDVSKSVYKIGDLIRTFVVFEGELSHGFFDNYIEREGKTRIIWSWDPKTLPDGDPKTPGTLNGKIRVRTSWSLPTDTIPPGKYIIYPRVYEHNIETNHRNIKHEEESIEITLKKR